MIFRWKIMSEGTLAGGPLMRAVRHASRAQPLES